MAKRVISALILSAVCILCLFVNKWTLGLLILLVSTIALSEFYHVAKEKNIHPVKWLGFGYSLILALEIFTQSDDFFNINFSYLNDKLGLEMSKKLAGINWSPILQGLFIVLMLAVLVFGQKKYNIVDAAYTIFGGYYVVLLSSFFYSVYHLGEKASLANGLENSKTLAIAFFIVTLAGAVASDTFALFTGLLLGKHKLAPEISPKKTIEGAIGGLVGSTLVLSIAGLILINTSIYTGISFIHYPIMGLIVGALAQIGDLAASSIKRYIGVKDYGNILPGHGGMLDRIDSYMYVFIFVYYYLSLI